MASGRVTNVIELDPGKDVNQSHLFHVNPVFLASKAGGFVHSSQKACELYTLTP